MVHLLPGEIIPGYYLRYNVRKSVHKNYPNQYNTIIVYVWKKSSSAERGKSTEYSSMNAEDENVSKGIYLREQKNSCNLKWEKINIVGNQEDVQRIGHQAVAYLDYLYIFGGFNGNRYLSKVNRLKMDAASETSAEFTWRANYGVEFETCNPWKQSYETIKTNMMSPRASHSATGFEKHVYIFGGAIHEQPCTSNIYVFNTESFEWTLLRRQGSSPSARFSHAATKIDSAKRFILISGGICVDVGEKKTVEREMYDIWTFDIDLTIWVQIDVSLNTENCNPRYGHQAVSFAEHEVFIFGGEKNCNNEEDDHQSMKNKLEDKRMLNGLSLHMNPPWPSSKCLI